MATIQELKSIPLLQELQESELEALSKLVAKRSVKKNAHLLLAEDEGRQLMFILSGKVKVSLAGDDGREVTLALLGEGEIFGELALLTGETRSADVIAFEHCEILTLSADDFEHHALSNNGLTLALLREIAQRLRAASSMIGDLVLFDVYRRVARTLKNIAQEKEVDDQKFWLIDERPTHQELAAMVGTSREMVTRALKGLEEDGHVKIDGKRVEIYRLPL